MTCEEFKALAQVWAIGALDEAEVAACEAHLASPRLHAGCESALVQAEQAAHLLVGELAPVMASEAIWNGIERQLTRETDAVVRRASTLPRWSRVSRTLALAASVAVGFLLLGRSFGARESGRATEALRDLQTRTAEDLALSQTARAHVEGQFEACRRDLKVADDSLELRQRALALLAEPATEVVGLAPQGSFNAGGSVILNRPKHKAMVFAKSLAAVSNRDYELWVIRAGEKIPAGLLKVEASGSSLALIDEQILQAGVNVFAITLEPAGGSTAPRGPLVLVGEVKKG